MKTITCLICERQHALFYTRHSDSKLTLNYICDRVPKEKITDILGWDNRPIFEKRYHTEIQEIPFRPDLDIPVRWSTRYAHEQANKQQTDLNL